MLFYEILKSLALTHTFLFIGCGIDDPDIRMLFEDIQFAHGRMPHHYMTVSTASVASEVLTVVSELMHVKFMEYDPSNNHAMLTASLADLAQKVEDARNDLRVNGKW